MSDTGDKVREIIADELGVEMEKVTDDAAFVEDLGADSLDLTELLMALEEEYQIDIDDEANEIQTVGDAVNYIKSKI